VYRCQAGDQSTPRSPPDIESVRAISVTRHLTYRRRALAIFAATLTMTATAFVTNSGAASAAGVVRGMDVSGWQGNVDWSTAYANGARFAIVKATEGTSFQSSYFSQQYIGSYGVGMIRGAYHFARPEISSGAAQADFFVDNGGGWSRDGKTLPGELDIEWNPYSHYTCYGLSKAGMIRWIRGFSNRYHFRTHRWPMIYTAESWWRQCTGNGGDFSSTNPLSVARWASSVGTLPYAWTFQTIWQYADHGIFPGDQDRFNGSWTRLRALANG
jgi:GH25 family lysozyme M1 (1,4-beta-N-acetylmuramidase)